MSRHLLKIASVGGHSLSFPAPATPGAAALDIRSSEHVTLFPGEEVTVGTGFAYEPPPFTALFLLPRSGLSTKHGIVLGNLVGLIDPDYRGELKVALWYRRHEGPPITLQKGERIAQLVCLDMLPPVETLHVMYSDLSRTDRDDGGFGSTGE